MTEKDWQDVHEIMTRFPDADSVGNGRVVFNICHNRYRLIVFFRYEIGVGYIKFIGTHRQYDMIKDIKNI